MSHKYILFFGMLLISCGAPPTAALPPTPQAVIVAHTPALRNLGDVLRDCGDSQTEIAVYFEEIPPSTPGIPDANVTLRLGAPLEGFYAAQVGWESIAVIVNADNPVATLTSEELLSLFTGQSTSMRVWSYPEGDDTRRAFDTAVLFGQRLTREAQLAPDPQAMLEAISSNTTAIGYLPERWVQNNPGVRSVSLNQKLAEALRQPVLALSEGEPVGNVRTLLLCLQSRLSSGTK